MASGHRPAGQDDGVLAVDFAHLDAHLVIVRGVQGGSNVIGLDGELAVAAVDQHRQLNGQRTPEIRERVHGGANGASGVQHVIHQHHVPGVERAGNMCRLQRPALAGLEVVAVERDVDGADGDLGAGVFLDEGAEPHGQRHAAGADADEDEARRRGMACANRAADAPQRLLNAWSVQHLTLTGQPCPSSHLQPPSASG